MTRTVRLGKEGHGVRYSEEVANETSNVSYYCGGTRSIKYGD